MTPVSSGVGSDTRAVASYPHHYPGGVYAPAHDRTAAETARPLERTNNPDREATDHAASGSMTATRNLTDDTARLAMIQVRLLVMDGSVQRLRQITGLTHGQLGKACGVTGEQVDAWERGIAEPSAAQAIAWLDTLTRSIGRTPQMGFARNGEKHQPAWSR